MMYKKIFCSVVFLLCILVSCEDMYYGYWELGNDYAYIENREIVKIRRDINDNPLYDILIRGQVLNYDYDDKYIIAYQVYDKDYHYEPIEERDSLQALFEKTKKIRYCYWIINKETGKVFGPMKKKEFENRCKVMHIEAKMKQWKEKAFIGGE